MSELIKAIVLLLACEISLCGSQVQACSGQVADGQCTKRQEGELPLICVIIRTYRGHGDQHFPYLEELLHSLRSQTYPRCAEDGPKLKCIWQDPWHSSQHTWSDAAGGRPCCL